MAKSKLRHVLRTMRKGITEIEQKIYSEQILEQLEQLEQFKSAKTILMYNPVDDEVDLTTLIDRETPVAFPRCLDDNNMEFRIVSDKSQLEIGKFDILEPTQDCPLVTDFDGTICIVPAIAYDHQNNRLGYGKGYYDRFLKSYTGYKIGVCVSLCYVQELPVEENDIPVDIVIAMPQN